jgi:hypothetical protein
MWLFPCADSPSEVDFMSIELCGLVAFWHSAGGFALISIKEVFGLFDGE